MKLHLVGGFLGSGKTTAIISATKALMARGLRVGVVTNDQGKYLVDTSFLRYSKVPTVEVTGGCFCCNYADLDQSLDQLIDATQPDVIFAESVGSCADLVATVVKPLLSLKQVSVTPTSFSVFADVRLLRRRLLDQPMPFSEDVVYIFDKQLEEAGLIVLNKMDLLPADEVKEVEGLLRSRHPATPLLAQTSLQPEGTQAWLELLDEGKGLLPQASLDIDYQRYGHGEAQLAWLDEEVTFNPQGEDASRPISAVIRAMVDRLRQNGIGIGHMKFIIRADGVEAKISLPTLEESGWEKSLPDQLGGKASLLVNARVEMGAEELSAYFNEVLEGCGCPYEVDWVSSFHPKQPNPTYRFK